MTSEPWPASASRKCRLLVLGGVWPYVHGNLEAANVITYEILSHFLAHTEWEVSFCVVNSNTESLRPSARAELDSLVAKGLRILEPIDNPTPRTIPWVRRLLGMLVGDPVIVLPGAGAKQPVERACAGCGADAVLTVWSEVATAAAADLGVVKCAYYGNPDHKVIEAGARFEWERSRIGPRSAARYLVGRFAAIAVRRAHLTVMRRYALVADVAANDAAFYRAHGVSNARYLQNMWPGDGAQDWRERRRAEERIFPAKIVASVGNLSATGNTLGFDTLARHVLPAMTRRLGTGTFELHLYGARRPHSLVAPFLADPHIRIRGFVEDLDGEILSAPIFLVANNHKYFKVGHTRFLHAWSLGACVVTFRDSAEAMPEIVHGENALLAGNPDEMAELVRQALSDRALRERLGECGRRTLVEKFSPRVVCTDLAEAIRDAVSDIATDHATDMEHATP